MISSHLLKFYIDGAWVTPLSGEKLGVENPATEAIILLTLIMLQCWIISMQL